MLDFSERVKKEFGLPFLTTAYMFRDTVKGVLDRNSAYATMTDWHCPQLGCFDMGLAELYRSKGKSVWVYTCCNPRVPMMNLASYEYPLIECRLMGWLVRGLKADGYLYWHVNFWEQDLKLDEDKTFFPRWKTANIFNSPGDGVFLYPGKRGVLSGIRLANVRDGVEDYEWLQLAERKVGREVVDRLVQRLVRDRDDFARDSALLRHVRTELGDLIER